MKDEREKTKRKFIKKQLNLAPNRKADVVVNKIRGLTNRELIELLDGILNPID